MFQKYTMIDGFIFYILAITNIILIMQNLKKNLSPTNLYGKDTFYFDSE